MGELRTLHLVATAQQLGNYPSRNSTLSDAPSITSDAQSSCFSNDENAADSSSDSTSPRSVRRRKSSTNLREEQDPFNLPHVPVAPIRGFRRQRDGSESDSNSVLSPPPPPSQAAIKHRVSRASQSVSMSSSKHLDRLALSLAKAAPIQVGIQSEAWQLQDACQPYVRLMTTCDISALSLKLKHSPAFTSVCVTDPALCGHPIKFYSPGFKLGPRGLTIGACMFLNLQHGGPDDWSLEVQLGRDGRPHFIMEWSGTLVKEQGHLFVCSQIDVTDSIREMASYECQRRLTKGNRPESWLLDEAWEIDWTKFAIESAASSSDLRRGYQTSEKPLPFSDCPVIGPFLKKAEKIKAAHKRYFMLSPKPKPEMSTVAANPRQPAIAPAEKSIPAPKSIPPQTSAQIPVPASASASASVSAVNQPAGTPSRLPGLRSAIPARPSTPQAGPTETPNSPPIATPTLGHSRRLSKLPFGRTSTAPTPASSSTSSLHSRGTSIASVSSVSSVTTQSTTKSRPTSIYGAPAKPTTTARPTSMYGAPLAKPTTMAAPSPGNVMGLPRRSTLVSPTQIKPPSTPTMQTPKPTRPMSMYQPQIKSPPTTTFAQPSLPARSMTISQPQQIKPPGTATSAESPALARSSSMYQPQHSKAPSITAVQTPRHTRPGSMYMPAGEKLNMISPPSVTAMQSPKHTRLGSICIPAVEKPSMISPPPSKPARPTSMFQSIPAPQAKPSMIGQASRPTSICQAPQTKPASAMPPPSTKPTGLPQSHLPSAGAATGLPKRPRPGSMYGLPTPSQLQQLPPKPKAQVPTQMPTQPQPQVQPQQPARQPLQFTPRPRPLAAISSKPKPKPFSHSVSYTSPSLFKSVRPLTASLTSLDSVVLAQLEKNLEGDRPFRMTLQIADVPDLSPSDGMFYLYATPVSNGAEGRARSQGWVCFLVERKPGMDVGVEETWVE